MPNARFRETIDLGVYNGTSKEFNQIIDDLRLIFLGNSYNIVTRNCNHFSDAFVKRLINRPIPAYINRLAYFGSFCTCLLPPSMLGNAPVDDSSSTSQSVRGGMSSSGGGGNNVKVAAFKGTGYKLGSTGGGENQDQSSERLLGSSSNNNNNNNSRSSSSDDARAKAREAALQRFGR